MDPQRVLVGLVAVAARAGVEVRSTPLRGTHPSAGGLCRLNGKLVVLLNSKASPVDRCMALADALGGLSLNDIEIEPELQALLTRRRKRTPSPRSGVRPTGPGLASTSGNGKRRRSMP